MHTATHTHRNTLRNKHTNTHTYKLAAVTSQHDNTRPHGKCNQITHFLSADDIMRWTSCFAGPDPEPEDPPEGPAPADPGGAPAAGPQHEDQLR